MRPPEFGPSPRELLVQQLADDPQQERSVPKSALGFLLHVGRLRLAKIICKNTFGIDPQNSKHFIITGEEIRNLRVSLQQK